MKFESKRFKIEIGYVAEFTVRVFSIDSEFTLRTPIELILGPLLGFIFIYLANK